jgi:hypothetical protein
MVSRAALQVNIPEFITPYFTETFTASMTIGQVVFRMERI